MPRTVLVVDDSVTIRQMVSFTLKHAGFSVVEACDGQDALERLGSARVDLVITDLNMPRMDGTKMIRLLRGRPVSKYTPVIMLTTESQNQSAAKVGRRGHRRGWLSRFIPTNYWR